MSILNYSLPLIFTLISIIFFRSVALAINLVDYPAGHKQHQGVIPLVGGLGMYIGFTFGIYLQADLWHQYFYLLIGGGFLLMVGVLDDLFHLAADTKLIAQLIAVGLMIKKGIILYHLGNLLFFGDINLSYLAIPITCFAAIGIINVINMLDGMDGLAGGVTLIIILTLALFAFIHGANNFLAPLMILASTIIIFLYFNLNKSIFMGNGGSMFLGYALVWFLISCSQGEHKIAQPMVMLAMMALPLYDTWRVMFYRIKRGLSPFRADRIHLHHVLLNLGFNTQQTTFFIISMTLLINMLTIIFNYYHIREAILFLFFTIGFFVYLKISQLCAKKI
jgi:UDP-GlcNAc:undecaprenyl-phosphate/decaprenyl-phosphate GlcNAc-1-phosphate transferase